MNVNVFSTFVDLQASDDAEARNLMHVQADAVMVQETHLAAKACDEEASRMLGLGWNAFFLSCYGLHTRSAWIWQWRSDYSVFPTVWARIG